MLDSRSMYTVVCSNDANFATRLKKTFLNRWLLVNETSICQRTTYVYCWGQELSVDVLHEHKRSAVIAQATTTMLPATPSKLPIKYTVLWVHPSQHSKRHLLWFSVFCDPNFAHVPGLNHRYMICVTPLKFKYRNLSDSDTSGNVACIMCRIIVLQQPRFLLPLLGHNSGLQLHTE